MSCHATKIAALTIHTTGLFCRIAMYAAITTRKLVPGWSSGRSAGTGEKPNRRDIHQTDEEADRTNMYRQPAFRDAF